jgi:hypothetical protein
MYNHIGGKQIQGQNFPDLKQSLTLFGDSSPKYRNQLIAKVYN